jgi:hypothetical protein
MGHREITTADQGYETLMIWTEKLRATDVMKKIELLADEAVENSKSHKITRI